jgi:hypothetical protein
MGTALGQDPGSSTCLATRERRQAWQRPGIELLLAPAVEVLGQHILWQIAPRTAPLPRRGQLAVLGLLASSGGALVRRPSLDAAQVEDGPACPTRPHAARVPLDVLGADGAFVVAVVDVLVRPCRNVRGTRLGQLGLLLARRPLLARGYGLSGLEGGRVCVQACEGGRRCLGRRVVLSSQLSAELAAPSSHTRAESRSSAPRPSAAPAALRHDLGRHQCRRVLLLRGRVWGCSAGATSSVGAAGSTVGRRCGGGRHGGVGWGLYWWCEVGTVLVVCPWGLCRWRDCVAGVPVACGCCTLWWVAMHRRLSSLQRAQALRCSGGLCVHDARLTALRMNFARARGLRAS